jgi:uncharacterized protein YccT (UPF0319 family)
MGCSRSKVQNKSSSSLDEETRELVEEYQKIIRRKSEPIIIIRRPIIRTRRVRANSEPID